MYDAGLMHILNRLEHLQQYVHSKRLSELSAQLLLIVGDISAFQLHHNEVLLVLMLLIYKI
jgi:hypothetical protein